MLTDAQRAVLLTDAQRAVLLARLRRGRDELAGAVPRRPAGAAELPASFGQEQLWFVDRFAPGLPTYNLPLAIAISGPLDTAALGQALDGLVSRHETLRTRLATTENGRPVQVIDPPTPQPLELADLSGAAPQRRQTRLREFIDSQAMRPFALASDRLLRTYLIRLSGAEHVLLIVVHHAVFDGWSAGVLVRELAALYQQEAGGEPACLAELPVQFADYALWERDRLSGAELAELEYYWQGALAGLPTVQFPADRPRPVVESFDGGLAVHTTDLELLDRLRELSRRERTTPFVTLLAGLLALLYRYTGQSDLVVGTVSANRGRAELAPLIGFLVGTLPIRADLSGDPAFTELLGRVRQSVMDGYAHQDLPFGKLVQALAIERDPSRTPVFQIAFSYAERDSAPAVASASAGDVEFVLTDLVVGIRAAKFDLALAAEARPGGLWLECSYKTALFDPATVRRLLAHLEVLLRGALADPSARLSRLPVLTGAELHRELADWNDTAAPVPATCVHQAFQAQAARTPHAVAAEYDGTQISYAQLNARANQIARRLRALGVRPETLAGVCMSTGLDRLAALLGIWKAGGGYVPLDSALPADRLSYIITDTAMTVIITDQHGADRLPARPGGPPELNLDASWPAISELADADPDGTCRDGRAVTPANIAYVIYTSGSTGRPKGVVVEHRHAVNFLHGMIERWRIGPSSTVLQFAAYTFDVSVMDMFMPLLGGGRVVLAPVSTLHSPPRLAALIRDRKITFASLTPSVLSLLNDEHFADLQVLTSGAEELPSDLASRWLRSGLRFVNAYGPTEATVTSTFIELDASTPLPPPIGRPMPNCLAYVLDAHLNPVPTGVTGELYIGGAGVTRGYLHRQALTASRFISDPFTPGKRLYRTGDLARRRPDGTIAFAGRIDDQIKIRGLRIELGEIETVLAAHPAIAKAVVTVSTTPAGDKQLTAYFRAEPGSHPAISELRAQLARALPAYMIPAQLIAVAAFPLTASGKIDRAALPAPERTAARASYTPPATFIETVLTDIFGTVLRSDRVSSTDSFFDIGGSSLAVMQLVAQLGSALAVDLDVSAVFLAPSPRQLAAVLRDEHGFDDTGLDADGSPLATAGR